MHPSPFHRFVVSHKTSAKCSGCDEKANVCHVHAAVVDTKKAVEFTYYCLACEKSLGTTYVSITGMLCHEAKRL